MFCGARIQTPVLMTAQQSPVCCVVSSALSYLISLPPLSPGHVWSTLKIWILSAGLWAASEAGQPCCPGTQEIGVQDRTGQQWPASE